MASNIAVYYRFDTDDVINNTMRNAITGTYDATVTPNSITTANYFIGKSALNIDENNSQFATMPASLTIPQSGFSIAFWIASNNIKTSNATIFEFANSTGAYGTGKYALSMVVNSSSQLVFTYYHNSGTPAGTLTSTISVNDNIWRHVLITFTSANVGSLYINGRLNARATFSNYPFSTTYAVSYIGRNTIVSTTYFTGSIDDFRIYTYAISSEADINYLIYYPNYNIYTTSPSQTALLGNTISNFYDMNNTNVSQIYTPRTIPPGTIVLISGKPNQNFDTGDLTASSTTYVLPAYCIFDTVYRNLYVCDQGTGKLKTINMYTGVVNTIYTYTNVNSVEFDVSNVNYYLTGQSFIPQIDLSTNLFQRNINTNALTNTVYGLTDNSNNIFISHATGIARINLSGSLPVATSAVITTTVQMEQMCFKSNSQTDIYAIDVSNTWIYVINKTTNANYKITLPPSLFTNNPNTDLAGIVFDSRDNLYVGGVNGNNNIYMIPYYVINAISSDTTLTSTQIVLYAGTSSIGYSGDGGPASNAQFINISHLSIDAGDNLYICDSGSYTIRKIINGGARKTNFMNMIRNETSVVMNTASDLKTVYSGIYSIGGAGASVPNYSNYCINNTSTIIETELQSASYNIIDNSGLLIYYKFNPMDTSGIQVSNYSSGMPIFDASMSDTTMCSSNDYLVESGALNMSATSIGTWSRLGSVPNSSLLLPNNPSINNYHGMSFGSWNSVAVSKSGLYVAGVGDFHNFYTNYNTNYNIFSQLYTVPTVELVGGTGTQAYAGDGGIVTRAQFSVGLGNFIFTPTGYYISNQYTIRFVNNQSIITTICGTNSVSSSGSFGPATTAAINSTRFISFDTSNNFLYVPEYSSNVVRRIDKNGIIYPFCGTGTASSTGDGGLATLATTNTPYGIAVDTSNNVYITEDTGARIRMIDFSTNIITTLAGTGTAGFNDNVAGSSAQFNRPLTCILDASRNLYISDHGNHRIRKITSVNGVLSSSCIVSTICGTGTQGSTGDGRLATIATLNFPNGLSFNSDYSYLYVGQNDGRNIRLINMKSGIINRIVGTGVTGASTGNGGNPLLATMPGLFDNTLDPSGNLYFNSGSTLGYVRRLTPLASFPPFFKQPYDQVWSLYGLSWKYISISGNGQYQIAYMNNFGTYLSNGYGSINSWDYIADLSGIYTNGAALSYTGQYQSVIDIYGNIYVSSAYGVNSSWSQRFVNTRNTNFTPMPAKIACSFDGRYQVATAFRHQQVTRIGGTGVSGSAGDNGQATSAQFAADIPVSFDSSNNIIICDAFNHRVRRINARTGIITTIAGTGTATFPAAGGTATAVTIAYPFGLIVDISNNYYLNIYNGIVKVTGTTLAILGGSGTAGFSGDGAVLSTTTRCTQNKQLCCDTFNNMYFAEYGNRRIRKITATNNFVSTICGTGTASSTGDGGLATLATINNPGGCCCDSFNNIYISELTGNRVRKIDALSGIITTICGTGTASSTGDGGPASSATVHTPISVCCDRANNLYITELGPLSAAGGGNRIRKIRAINGQLNSSCIVTTYAGTGTYASSGANGLPTQVSVTGTTYTAIDNNDNYYFNDSSTPYLYKITQFANVIVSSNYGQTWSDVTTNITGNIAFNNVAVSQTGQYMTATALNGRIYRSTNFGASGSWGVTNSSIDNWGSVVVSSTGQYQVASGYDMSGVYSTDFGLNWIANGMPNGNWSSLALAEDTNTLYAVSRNAGLAGSSIYVNRSFNLPTSGLNSEWITVHNPILKSANWPTVNGVSFSFWCKSNNNSSNARFFDFGNGLGYNNIIMYVFSNNLAYSVYLNGGVSGGGNDQNTGIPINDNTWRHVCWTMTYASPNATDSVYTIYINGVNVYQQTNQTFTYYPNIAARQNCFIGKSNWAIDASFNGVIDDFRIYNRVVSEREVFELYSATESIHYYKFDNDSDFTNTQLANYNTLRPTYDGRQYTKDPGPPIITTATQISFGTYITLLTGITNMCGMAVTQNNKRIFAISNGSTVLGFSDYNTNTLVWNSFTSVSITNLPWTGIKSTADGSRVVMCAPSTYNANGGLYYSYWTGTTYASLTTINISLTTSLPRFYTGVELTANGDRLIAIADYVYFATWSDISSNYINLTATTLAVGSAFITYDAGTIIQKYNMYGGIACNADGSRIAYTNSLNEIYFATWNGTTYVNPVLIADLDPCTTGMTMSYDGSLLFYSNVSDISQKIFYSIWNGTTYSVQTELSYNLVLSLNSSITDGLPLFTPAGTLYMALSYDMSTLYISTNANSAYLDTTTARSRVGTIYSLPLTYTNTSTMTKKVGTGSLVVQRQNTIAISSSLVYIPYFTPTIQPFFVPAIGNHSITLTDDNSRAVTYGYNTGTAFYSTLNKATGLYSAFVPIPIGIIIVNQSYTCKMTADGSRLVLAIRSTGCYFSTWLPDQNNYSNMTITLGSTTQQPGALDMTADGSRIFTISANGVYYADWNGTNYTAWISLGIAGSAILSAAIGCSGDGMRIVYVINNASTLSWAFWNGYTYVIQGTVSRGTSSTIRNIRLNYDGSILFHNASDFTASSRYNFWNGSGYSSSIIVPAAAIPLGLDSFGINISPDLKQFTVGGWVNNGGVIYQTAIDLKAPTRVGTLTIPDTKTYITPSIYSSGTNYSSSQPFTTVVGLYGFSITQNGLRAVVVNATTVYVSTFNGNGSVWSSFTATSATTTGTTLINIKLTADGSRGVTISRGGPGFAYFFSWTGSTYSAFTQTLGATSSTYQTIDMTADGSRIFTVDAAFVKYADWNGTNYGAWSNTTFVGSGMQTATVGCSSDGNRIVFCCNASTLSYALWNGSAYVLQSTFGTVTAGIARAIRFSSDNNYVFFSQNSATPFLRFSAWNGTGFGALNTIPVTGVSADAYPLAVSYDSTTVYVGAFDGAVANRIYQVPFVKQPFNTVAGIYGISITQNGLRAVVVDATMVYVSTFDGSVWSSFTATSATTTNVTFINVKLTADGSRGVTISRAGTGFAYFFTWTGSSYSALTQTLGATSTNYFSIDMTADGSRIFTMDGSFLKYADWNGTNYGAWTNAIATTSFGAVGCSSDGNRIVYCNLSHTSLNYALWNGSSYVLQSTFGTVTANVVRCIRFSSDNNYVFFSQSSASPFLLFSPWNGTGFGSLNNITLNGVTSDSYPLAVSNDMSKVYVGSYDASVVNRIYEVPVIKQPFTTPDGMIGISITQDGLRIVFGSYNNGLMYFSTFNGSVWSTPTQTLATALANSLISLKITADGSRGVCTTRAGPGFAYYFTWNGTNYSALTQTLGATSSTNKAIDMTANGSRIFTVDAAFVKYADWNGSNYGAWVNTSFVGSAGQTAAIGCSADGFRIVYCCNTATLNYAAWNGASYVNISTFGLATVGAIKGSIRFSYDGNYVFYGEASASPFLFFSVWNGTGFGNRNSIPLNGITAEPFALAVSYDLSNIFVGSWDASVTNRVYQLPLTLKTIRPNTTGISFSFWVKSIASPDYGGLISLQSIYGWILMYILGDRVFAAINEQRPILPASIYPTTVTKNAINVATITQYTWNHIAWTIQQQNTNYDVSGSAIWTVYLNGNSVYQNTNQTYPYPGTRTTNFVGYNGQLNTFMNGNMDDYRAYNRVLSAREIQNIYINSPNATYEQSAVLPAGLQSEVSATYTISTYDAIPKMTNYITAFRDISASDVLNGCYILGQSSNLTNYYSYNGFDRDPATFYHTAANIYNSTTGAYIGNKVTTIQGFGDISGEWLQTQTPYQLQVTSYSLRPRNLYVYRFPGTWYLLGSNDNVNWYAIDYRVNFSYSVDPSIFTVNQGNTNYYFYLRFVWITAGPSNQAGTPKDSINLSEINYAGVARYLNYYYFNQNNVKTYLPRLQSNNFTTWRLAVDNSMKDWINAAISNDGTLLAAVRTPASASLLFRSVDYGITWAQFSSGATANQIAIAANGTNSAISAALATPARYSINGGTTWATGTSASANSFIFVAMNAAGTTTVFGSAGTAGNYYSTNGGQTTTASTGGLSVANTGLGISSSGLYVLTTYTSSTTIYRSINSGVEYSATSSISTTWGNCVIEDTGLAFAFTLAGQLYRSTNFGVNWSTVSSHPVEGVSSISMSTSGQYVLTSTPTRIYYSNDYGVSFSFKSIIPFSTGTVSEIRISRDGRIAAVTSFNRKIFFALL